METCTETFYCKRKATNTDVVELKLHVKWYKWGRIQALNYDKFDTTEEQAFATSVIGGADICGKDLTDPDTENSIDVYNLDIPLALPFGPCGTTLDKTAGSVSFAFKIYDGLNNSAMIDKWADTILKGTCFYEDLAIEVNVTVANNGPSIPTVMPPRIRTLKLEIVDRPYGDSAQVLTIATQGRRYYLLVTYIHGSPFNRWADPFGVYIDACSASNNAGFLNDPTSWERSEEFITASCPVAKTSLQAVWLEKAFEADPAHALNPPVEGNTWYQVAGPILAARWNKLNGGGTVVKEIFLKCTVIFCTLPDEFSNCADACTTDRRKRRSADDEEKEVLYTSIIIEDSTSDSEGEPVTGTYETPCTNYNVALTTLVALLALLLISATLCILLFVKLTTAKRHLKWGSSMKKTGLKN